MEWYLVSEPKVAWSVLEGVDDGDRVHVRDDLGRRFRYSEFTGGANKRAWFQMAPLPDKLDCTSFDCPKGGQHEWDNEPAPVTSSSGTVHICKTCDEPEEKIRGYLESKWLRSGD